MRQAGKNVTPLSMLKSLCMKVDCRAERKDGKIILLKCGMAVSL
jgi:hypothetical protein